jgi:hypothetical protein
MKSWKEQEDEVGYCGWWKFEYDPNQADGLYTYAIYEVEPGATDQKDGSSCEQMAKGPAQNWCALYQGTRRCFTSCSRNDGLRYAMV